MMSVVRGIESGICPGGHKWTKFDHTPSTKNALAACRSGEEIFMVIENFRNDDEELSFDNFAEYGCVCKIVRVTDLDGNDIAEACYTGGPVLVEFEGLRRARMIRAERRGYRVFAQVETAEVEPGDIEDDRFQDICRNFYKIARKYQELRRIMGTFDYIDLRVEQMLDDYRDGKADLPDATLCTYMKTNSLTESEILSYDSVAERDAKMTSYYLGRTHNMLNEMMQSVFGLYRQYALAFPNIMNEKTETLLQQMLNFVQGEIEWQKIDDDQNDTIN